MDFKEAQKWVNDDWKKNSKSVNKHLELLFLMEEIGEMAEMIRKQSGKKERKKLKIDLSKEMGDILVCLMTLANRYGIDLEESFLKTKKKIQQRHRKGY
ncbi:hypothetical protein IID20_04205 [Patescibacteria group bacterium]|nr:hypothetical protein [Patescibacteria group bacterium]